MKRIFALALSLLLLTACSPAAVPPATAVPTAQTQTLSVVSPAVQRKLTIVLAACNTNLSVREEVGAALSFSGASEHYTSTFSPATDTMHITQTDPGWNGGAQLTVPSDVYATIRLEAENSAFNLSPRASGYEVKADDCAIEIAVPPGYAGKLYTSLTDCAVSYLLSRQLTNYALRFGAENCATSLPDAWGDAEEAAFTLTRGTGAATLDFRHTDCAVKVMETSVDFASRYQDSASRSMMIRTDALELYLGDPDDHDQNMTVQSQKQALQAAKANTTANTVTPIKTLSANGITSLRVNANLCGVVLEPSQSAAFELTYIGVANTADVSVTTEVADGVLTVTAEGTDGVPRYICASAAGRVNCVRIGVPQGQLTSLILDNGRAIIATDELALPAVTGSAGSGLVALEADTVSTPVALSARNGSAVVNAVSVTGDIVLDARNGSVELTSESISGSATLTATNGSVDAKAGTVTGNVTLTAENGSVDADLDRVANAVIRADNGTVHVELGTITGSVVCGVRNGALEAALTRRPADLAFHITGGWEDRRDTDWGKDRYGRDGAPAGLPTGWYDGLVLGTGKPTLTLSCASNGYLSFSVPQNKS